MAKREYFNYYKLTQKADSLKDISSDDIELERELSQLAEIIVNEYFRRKECKALSKRKQ